MEFRFQEVSLRATVGGTQSWAHHLEIVVGEDGVTVEGGDAGGGSEDANNLPWDAVTRFAPGFALGFPDGRPATEVQVTLSDRELSFLVPAGQLLPAQLGELISAARSQMAGSQIARSQMARSQMAGSQMAGSEMAGSEMAGSEMAGSEMAGSEIVESTGSDFARSGANRADDGPGSARRAGAHGAESGAAHDAQSSAVHGSQILTSSSRRPTNRSRRRAAFGAAAVVVVAAIVTTLLLVSSGGSTASKDASLLSRNAGARTGRSVRRRTTSSTTTSTTSVVPSKELSGPPASVSPATAIAAVLIRPSDLRGWTPGGSAGQDVAGDGQAVAESTTGNPILPSTSSLVEPSFGILEQCSNLASDHLQLMTGNYYPGGPPTYSSNDFSEGAVNATQLQPTPQLFSIASEVASPQVQESDFSAYAASSFSSCLASFFTSYDRATYGQLGATVDGLTVHAVSAPQVPGVETLEFVLNGQLVSAGEVIGFRNTFVFMGAGRLEEAVSGTDSTDEPIPSATWRTLLPTLQHRMEKAAGER
jgi:hypothetical protein